MKKEKKRAYQSRQQRKGEERGEERKRKKECTLVCFNTSSYMVRQTMVTYCEQFRFEMSRTVVSDGLKRTCHTRVNRETATSFTSLHLTAYVWISNQN